MLKKPAFLTGNKGLFASILIILGCLAGCANDKPIRIGYVGELTGLRSGMGVDGRDSAQLAVAVINENGGINGRPLELITKNDQGDPAVAQQVDSELIEADVVSIIGHMTSGQSAAVIDQINESDVIMISPTTSSDEFTGQEDNFFRVMPATSIHGRALANHIYNQHQFEKIVGVYDLANRSFAETLWHVIQKEYQDLGGNAETAFPFTSDQTDLKILAQDILAAKPDAIVFVSSDVDTALLAQHIRQQGSDVPLFSSGWAQTDQLTAKGGLAVEGLEINALYNTENNFPGFQEFNDQFQNRFNRPPGIGAAYTYEAILVLAAALTEADGDFEKLPEILADIQSLAGVQGTISLDQFGDVNRGVYIAIIEDGQFKIIEEVSFDD